MKTYVGNFIETKGNLQQQYNVKPQMQINTWMLIKVRA